jgi:hypothetical protein
MVIVPQAQDSLFLALPNELKFNVLSRVGIPGLGVCSLVCNDLKQIAYDNNFWRRLFVRDFPDADLSQIKDFQAAYKARRIFHSNVAKGIYAPRMIGGPKGSNLLDIIGARMILGYGASFRIWDLKKGEWEGIFRVQPRGVNCLVVAGNRLISNADDRTIEIWDIKTGKCEGALLGHTDKIVCLAVTGDRLISGSFDRTIRIWDLNRRACERILTGHTNVVRSVAVAGNRLISGSSDRTIRFWDLQTGACERILTGHAKGISCLAVAGDRLISGSYDKMIRIWDLKLGVCDNILTGHKKWITEIAIAGDTLCSGDADGIRFWDLNTGAFQRFFEALQYGEHVCLGVAGNGFVGDSGSTIKILVRNTDPLIRFWDFSAADEEVYKDLVRLFKMGGPHISPLEEYAMKRFSSMPKKQRNKIYEEMLQILRSLNKDYSGNAEHAFHDTHGESSAPQQKAQAIEAYLAKTGRPLVEAEFKDPQKSSGFCQVM